MTAKSMKPSPAALRLSEGLGDIARELDARLERAAGTRVAFTLIVWTDGAANYISSASREDVLRELPDFMESMARGDPPLHRRTN